MFQYSLSVIASNYPLSVENSRDNKQLNKCGDNGSCLCSFDHNKNTLGFTDVFGARCPGADSENRAAVSARNPTTYSTSNKVTQPVLHSNLEAFSMAMVA